MANAVVQFLNSLYPESGIRNQKSGIRNPESKIIL
jgi:hypothetical protein